MELEADPAMKGSNSPEQENLLNNLNQNTDNINYVAEIFQDVQNIVLFRLFWLLLFVLILCSVFVWYFLEQNIHEYAQACYFIVGAVSQIVISMIIIQNYNFYDPRMIVLAK